MDKSARAHRCYVRRFCNLDIAVLDRYSDVHAGRAIDETDCIRNDQYLCSIANDSTKCVLNHGPVTVSSSTFCSECP